MTTVHYTTSLYEVLNSEKKTYEMRYEGISPMCVFSCLWLFETPWTVAHQTLLSMEFSRQEYWSGLSFPFPGDLPNTGTEPTVSCVSCIGGQIIYHCTTHHSGSPHLDWFPTLMLKKYKFFKSHNKWGRGEWSFFLFPLQSFHYALLCVYFNMLLGVKNTNEIVPQVLWRNIRKDSLSLLGLSKQQGDQ